MVDGEVRRSPLDHYAGRLAEVGQRSNGAVAIEELPFLGQISLRLDPQGQAAKEAGVALGFALPLEPGTTGRDGATCAMWLGPDEWLVACPASERSTVEASLRGALDDESIAVVDVSAQRTALRISGPSARDLLAHGCALDLHPSVLTEGRCVQTMLARAQVILIADDVLRSEFRVFVRSSFAEYLALWLIDAAHEYTHTEPAWHSADHD